jgi:hypothetical protein
MEGKRGEIAVISAVDEYLLKADRIVWQFETAGLLCRWPEGHGVTALSFAVKGKVCPWAQVVREGQAPAGICGE